MRRVNKFKKNLVFITFSTTFLVAEISGQRLHFEHYTVDDGLQNNIVFSAAEDAKGLIWFATTTGIDRFDGTNFVHYPLPVKNNGQTNYISVPFITADYKKRIWAASASNIYLYNVQKDAFELPVTINNWNEKSKTITCLFAGNNGKLLFAGTNNSFFIFDTEKEKVTAPEHFNGFVRCIFQDNKGVIWVSTSTKALYRFVRDNEKINELTDASSKLTRSLQSVVTGISQDGTGRYWITTTDGKLFVYSERGDSVQSINPLYSSSHPYAIKDVFQDSLSQNTLVSTDGGGLVVIDKNLSVTGLYQANEDDLSSLSNNAVYDIFEASHKRLWITTYGGGINVVVPTAQPFKNFLHEINNRNSLSNNAAKAVTEDGSGTLWFGTRKGISRWYPLTNTWKHYTEETNAPAFTSDNVLALAAAGDNIWAGTYGGGIIQINGKTNQIHHYIFNDKDSFSLGTNYVYGLLLDHKERLWAGGIRGPLSYLDIKKSSFTRIRTPVAAINCIVEDAQNDILIGTEKGVFKIAGDTMQKILQDQVTEKIICIYEDKPGVLWIGTLGGGLILAEKTKGVIQTFKTTDGLPSDVICGIVKDSGGDLWVGTSKGIAHYKKSTQKFTYYTKADGLAGSQVNFGAVFKTSRKEIVFGTTDGFSLFNPQLIRGGGYVPKIVFTGLVINNKKVLLYDENSPLTAQIDETKTLQLQYFQNSFSIDFINTSPAVSGKHLYSWKLQGFDKDWSIPSTVPTAVYTNLPSGNYTLLIKAFSKGGGESTVVRELAIIIKEPWWLSKWAIAGYLLLLISGALLFYNYTKIRNARKKFAERLRLNTSISHEIKTPLTLIKGPVNALADASEITEDHKVNIRLAQKNIQKLEAIISQFIDFQKSGFDKLQMQVKKDDIMLLLDDVTASFAPLMKEKNIHFTYKRPSERTEILFDREKMEKVLNNLLSNAVKYTPAGKDISVEVLKEAKYLHVNIADTGIGIPAEQQQFLFKGYFRADNTVNLKETGSGIGLNVAKELVELHNGKLSFTSSAEAGTAFSVKLPLHNEALAQYIIKEPGALQVKHLPEIEKIQIEKSVNKTVIIAEDNDELRQYLKSQLEASGYHVFAAPDGKEAWLLVQKCNPDLVITDVMMPYMNGFQLCLAIKNELRTSHIPVIMLTAIHDRDYLLEGYKSGADDYVKKPFDMNYILVRMDNLLQNRSRFRNKILSVFEQQETVTLGDPEVLWLKKATEHILDNLDKANFSVEKLSMDMAMSRPVMFRKFKAITGESPQQYINKMRMRKAVELLQKKELNINEVAYECGFEDAKYFSTHFKKHFGKTPTEYQKTISGTPDEAI